jgi:hypothetical protein
MWKKVEEEKEEGG